MLTSGHATRYAHQVGVPHRAGMDTDAETPLHQVLAGLGAGRGAVHEAGARRLLGLVAAGRGDDEKAEEHHTIALGLPEHAGAVGDLADVCRLLGDLLRRALRTRHSISARGAANRRPGMDPSVGLVSSPPLS